MELYILAFMELLPMFTLNILPAKCFLLIWMHSKITANQIVTLIDCLTSQLEPSMQNILVCYVRTSNSATSGIK